MAFPLVAIPLAIMAASQIAGAASNIYSQQKQRELYSYQKSGYERQLADWHKNVPNREIKYPEQSYAGHIRALDTGISQSYASTFGSYSRLAGQFAGGTLYGGNRSRSLYGGHTGRSSRYL